MNLFPRMRRAMIVALALLAIGAVQALAQDAGQPVLRRHVISTNPILDVFTWYNIEWEIRVSDRSTVGVFGSYITWTNDEDVIEFDEKYYSGTFFYRYYPTAAFKGFFISGRLGFYQVEQDDPLGKEEGNFAGMGIDVGYGWLLGEPQRVAVGIGIGAVRLFGGDLEDVQTVLPTIRFINVGVAF